MIAVMAYEAVYSWLIGVANKQSNRQSMKEILLAHPAAPQGNPVFKAAVASGFEKTRDYQLMTI